MDTDGHRYTGIYVNRDEQGINGNKDIYFNFTCLVEHNKNPKFTSFPAPSSTRCCGLLSLYQCCSSPLDPGVVGLH